MSNHDDRAKRWFWRALDWFPELLLTIPALIWLIFSAGIGVGAALSGGFAVGVGVFLIVGVLGPILFILLKTIGFGD